MRPQGRKWVLGYSLKRTTLSVPLNYLPDWPLLVPSIFSVDSSGLENWLENWGPGLWTYDQEVQFGILFLEILERSLSESSLLSVEEPRWSFSQSCENPEQHVKAPVRTVCA